MILTVALAMTLGLQETGPLLSLSDSNAAIWEGPFNTGTFFPEQPGEPDLTARYFGDDYHWPVWAVAGRFICPTPDGMEHPNACAPDQRDWVIRQAAAPQVENSTRPRHNGSSLSRRVQEGLQADADVNAVARDAGLIWREARLSTCPVAQEAFDALRNVSWVPTDHPFVNSSDELTLVLHADTIEVSLNTYLQKAQFTGWLAEGNPANRFNAFIAALEPCWSTPPVPAPWAEADAD